MTSPALVVVPAYQGEAVLDHCLEALLDADGRMSIVVVDDASTDGTAGVARGFARRARGRVQVVTLPRNMGFAAAVNRGVAEGNRLEAGWDPHRTIVLVNQDCVVARGFLAPLVAALEQPGVGIAGARLLDGDGVTLQHAGARIEPNGLTSHLGRGSRDASAWREARDVDYVCGALLAMKCGTWRRFGPLDEGYAPAYFEEVDLCVRVRREGLSVRYVPASEAVHLEAATSGKGTRTFYRRYHRSRLRFVVRTLAPEVGAAAWLRSELSWLAKLARAGAAGQAAALASAYLEVPYFLAERRRDRRRAA